jgi:hypothetical protein
MKRGCAVVGFRSLMFGNAACGSENAGSCSGGRSGTGYFAPYTP